MSSKPKNILFLMTDQHRPDHVGYASDTKVATPNIDRLAEGMVFSNCVTVNPVCTPARTALITGKYSRQIGTLAMSGDLSLQHPTYAQALQRTGYHTSAVGKLHYLQGWPWPTKRGKGFNLVKLKSELKKFGFDYLWESAGKQLALKNYCDYCDHLQKKNLLEKFRDFTADAGPNTMVAEEQMFRGDPFPLGQEDYVDVLTGDYILERIRDRPKDKPFFIFGSFCSPHPPHDPPREYLEQFKYEEVDDFVPGEKALSAAAKKRLYQVRRAYKGMVKLVDDQVGRILDLLDKEGILNDTVILFTSDHGEMMGDHGLVQKSTYYWQSARVPLVIRHPDYLKREVCDSPVELTDLTATMLDVAGLDAKKELSVSWPAFNDHVPCRSLMPILNGSKTSVRDFAFSEYANQEGNRNWQMLQTKRWKYVFQSHFDWENRFEEMLFDLENDPHELVNQIANPVHQEQAQWFRNHHRLMVARMPAGQSRWAPYEALK